ncbi:MAG: hypothetical protein AB7H93_22860 [Vicinamibacterales bacterium]
MVTVEGCVTRDDRAGSAVRALYVLTDRRPAPGPATAGSPAAPTSSGATAAGNGVPRRRLYVLRAATESIDLRRHVGRMVRATGATTAPLTTAPLAGRSPEATPVPAAIAPAGATGSPDDTANPPTLAVTALVGLDGECR